MMRVEIDSRIINKEKESLCEPIKLCNEALLSIEKEKAYREGYYAAMEHMEKLLHELRTGVRS